MFENIQPAPPDAILGLTEAFNQDTNPRKINLGVGVFKDEEGKTPILDTVREAERRLLDEEDTKNYLPMTGAPAYGAAVQKLLFGEGDEVLSSGRAFTAQTPGGTGALRVGGDFLKAVRPEAKLWISRPTWANHRGVFSAAGFDLEEYPYYDAGTKGVDVAAMRAALQKVPAGDVVLLHVCCHNPTGADLHLDQWAEIAGLAEAGGWVPFLDFAYQGFAVGIEEDAAAVRVCADRGIEFLVANSFAKNFSLYRERVGGLTLVARNKEQGAAALSHLKLCVRRNYSNPPAHGGLVVAAVLGDAALRARWEDEVAAMRERIKAMRTTLVDGLKQRGVTQDFSFIGDQNGMFSFSGLNDDQVDQLREAYGIYIVKGGRINVAGITPTNIDYLCDAIAAVV
jgi:aspartate/tyrosine/aromatic aminotransferase